jgi:23S rRNA (guanosine2251-2'-O)-methyltransferase
VGAGHKKYIYGFHAVESRIRVASSSVMEIYLDENRSDARCLRLIELSQQYKIKVSYVDQLVLRDIVPEASHQGVVALTDTNLTLMNQGQLMQRCGDFELILALDGVTDPRNLGAILRTACGLGVDAVIAPKDKSSGLTDVVEKTASGAASIIPYVQVTNLARSLRELKGEGFWIVGTDGNADQTISDLDLRGKSILVFGSEGAGMRRLTRETCDFLARVPMAGTSMIDSFNVSVAVGICLYEANRQRKCV